MGERNGERSPFGCSRRVPRFGGVRFLRLHFTVARLAAGAAAVLTFVAVLWLLTLRQRTVEVWIVQEPVAAGSPIDDALGVARVAADSPLLPALLAVTDTRPAGVAVVALAPGRPLLAGDVGPTSAPARTLAIEVPSAVVEALGLEEGQRIDVLAADGGTGEPSGSRLVVADLRIAGVRIAEGPVRSADVVVVEVTPGEAIEVSTAIERGGLAVVRATDAPAWAPPTVEPPEARIDEASS